jgi:hypothetical protein
MTRPRDLKHRPGCDTPPPRESRVGSWIVLRCPSCRATGTRKTDDESETDK